jgi:hypothetical protein
MELAIIAVESKVEIKIVPRNRINYYPFHKVPFVLGISPTRQRFVVPVREPGRQI